METTLRTRIARALAHNVLIATVLGAVLTVGIANTPTIQQENPAGVLECWNPHTAQITVVQGETCPTPVNPYAAQ